MEENKVKDMSFKYYYARSQRMAGYLMFFGGFKLLSLDPDRENSKLNIFKFYNSQPLLDCVERYRNLNK